ncbi:F-box only protein 36 [Labeo rohita]|uniref:F-box only protein 36 n=1 Tax=Labeo rohita TaxID=84645 RepID=A0ABQ8LWC4_LABRO|nr:F-box only protein 36 [Labeo rohita]
MVTTKHQNMASLLSEILFETNGQGPPPSKDFVVTPKEVFRNEIWEQAVPGHCDKIHEETEILAKIMGWKNIFEFYYKKGHASPA